MADHERTVELKQASNPFSVETLTDETTINGKTTRGATTTATARKLEITSDEGRALTTTL